MNADGDDEFQAAAQVTYSLLQFYVFSASRTTVQTRSLFVFLVSEETVAVENWKHGTTAPLRLKPESSQIVQPTEGYRRWETCSCQNLLHTEGTGVHSVRRFVHELAWRLVGFPL